MFLETNLKLIISFCIFCVYCKVSAQNIAINTSGSAANSSALLDISSTTTGLLIPRMTNAERTSLNPLPQAAQGLVVYQTDGTQGFYYNTSTTTTPSWLFLPPNSGTGAAWSTSGNSGTTAPTTTNPINNNFIGNTDSRDFAFATNNIERMRISSTGNITIGTAVAANVNVTGRIIGTLTTGIADNGIEASSITRGVFTTASPLNWDEDMTGVYGRVTGSAGATGGFANTSNVIGVYGVATLAAAAGAGTNVCGVWGRATIAGSFTATGCFAGYFEGRGYFSNNVGIGTTAPVSLLHISGTGTPGVRIQKTDATTRVWESRVSAAGNFVVYDVTGSQDVLTITNMAAAQPGRIQSNVTGTAAAPNFAFAGDANTGMYNAVADELSFATGGTQRLSIQANQSVWAHPIQMPSGSAAAPTLSFNGDVDNGIFSPGANLWAVTTSGAERLRIDASGNCGIGVTPTARFHLKDGHVRSEQTTAPTIAITTGNGIGAPTAITAGSTDTKGNITTTGTNGGGNTVLTITFNIAYTVAPTVVVTAANANAQACTFFVTSTTTAFVLNFAGGGADPSFNFFLIE